MNENNGVRLPGMLPEHPEAHIAKAIDMDNRLSAFTRAVYKEAGCVTPEDRAVIRGALSFDSIAAPEGLRLLYGDVHGHSTLSDGSVSLDEEIRTLRSRVNFCVLTDHDHGGVDHDTLYGKKWEKICRAAREACEEGVFSVLVGYERDSYPWYDNMIVYFGDHTHPMPEGAVRGETNESELAAWLEREDLFIAPHDTVCVTCSADYTRRPKTLLPHGMELISRGDCAEYFDHPLNVFSCTYGGSWRDLLKAGGHPAALGGSDSHDGTAAVDLPEMGFPGRYPGMTGVWAAENSPQAVFKALKQRHTYAFMGPERVSVFFGVNGGIMGDIVPERVVNGCEARRISWKIDSKVPVSKVMIIKNGEPYYMTKAEHVTACSFTDYIKQTDEDNYYLQITLQDGRMAWTSPCWVR